MTKLTVMRYLTVLIAMCLSVVSFASETPCLDPLACNFMEEGECFFTDENGDPCVIEGCTDVAACNFQSIANSDDGSCLYGCLHCGSGTQWIESIDQCIPLPSCQGDLNGDELVGVEDLLVLLSSFGVSCNPINEGWECGDPIQHYSYGYETVNVYGDCWFAENCRYLPEVSPSSAASYSPIGYVYNYQGNDVDSAQTTFYYQQYGALYNWAATQSWPLCPTGWHVPSDSDYEELIQSLDQEVSGLILKSSSGWSNDGNGFDALGMNFLPSGYRSRSYSTFNGEGNVANHWSRTAAGYYQAHILTLTSSDSIAISQTSYQVAGAAVRCLKGANQPN